MRDPKSWIYVALVLLSGFTVWACTANAPSEPDGSIAFIGARLIDGSGGTPVDDAVMVVRDGRIEAVGPADAVDVPAGAVEVDLAGKIIVPGLINTHGHVSDVLGLEGGHYDEANIERQLALYARYGVTTVASMGGDGQEAIEFRDAQDASLNRARIFVGGTIVTGPTPEEATAQVAANKEMNVDYIKIRVDDNLGASEKMPPEVYQAVIDAANEHGLIVSSHLYYLEDAKGLLNAGTGFVAHSVRDQEVDEELISLLKDNDVCYTPTLTREVSTYVYESEPDFFEDPFFLANADPAVLEQLKDPERQKAIQENQTLQSYKTALEMAMLNLKKVSDGGATIAFGTDTGPAGRFQGYFEHMELELMAESGLTPEQILKSATSDAARCLEFDELGTLEPGKWADFIVLDADPLEDIRNLREIDTVYIAGNEVPNPA